MYTPPIKGKYLKKPSQLQPTGRDFAESVGSVAGLVSDLKSLKTEVVDTVNTKLTEVDSKIQEVDSKFQEQLNKGDHAAQVLEQARSEVVEHIRQTQKGDPGKDADEKGIEERITAKIPKAIDTDKLADDILARIPKLDEKSLTKRILKALPGDKPSLKIIQEQIEIDPMSVIEKIMALPAAKLAKFKLKKENIDGLEQTMSAFNSQLGRGYLHGGGASKFTQLSDVPSSYVGHANQIVTVNSTATGLIFSSTIPTPDTIAWSSLTAPTANLSLAMATNTTTFTWTSGNVYAFDTNGNTLIGTATAQSFSATGTPTVPTLQVLGATAATAMVGVARFTASSGSFTRIALAKSNSNTIGTFTAVANGDSLGGISFQGADGTQFIEAGTIDVLANNTVSAGVVPGKMVLSTYSATGVKTAAITIDSAQQVGIGKTPTTTLDINGGILASTQIQAGNNIQTANGTAAFTGFRFTSNAGTGLYSAGGISFNVAVNTTNALSIDASQNVGIGSSATATANPFIVSSAGNLTQTATTAATSGANNNSPTHTLQGTYWTGSASANDSWTMQDKLGAGSNPTSTLLFAHSGTSGAANIRVPLLFNIGVAPTAVNTAPFSINVGQAGASLFRAMKIEPGNGQDGAGTYIEFSASDTTDGFGAQIGGGRESPGAGGLGYFFVRTGTNAQVERLRVTNGGLVGIGTGAATTALLHLAAGVATASGAALKFTSGVTLTTAEAGAMEWNGSRIFITQTSGPTRQTIAYLSDSGVAQYAHTIFTPTTGGTVSLTNNQYNIINPAGALLALTVNLPSSPANNDVVYIKFTQTISTVTYANGTVVDGITAPTAGGLTVLVYDSGTTSWY